MANGSTPPTPPLTTEGQRGATITNAYVGREMKAYAVFETEIQTIAFFNTLATIFFSVGAALLSYAIGIWTNLFFVTPPIPAKGEVLADIVAPILCVLAAIFFILGVWALLSKRDVWKGISKLSKP